MQTWSQINIVSGVRENKDRVSNMLKWAYVVNSDVTWSCRPMKKEQRCKTMLPNTKMTPKLILDATMSCDTGLMKMHQCVLGPHMKYVVPITTM